MDNLDKQYVDMFYMINKNMKMLCLKLEQLEGKYKTLNESLGRLKYSITDDGK